MPAIAFLPSKDFPPVTIDQPKSDRSRRLGRVGRFAYGSRDV